MKWNSNFSGRTSVEIVDDQDLEIHASTTTRCSSLVFLARASIRSFLRPHWRNRLHGV
ncbi:hypothetical protein ZEAMMB73_Zm00001d024994 [Zea mays]|uniref:Uncharacterized protein n=1 Tax=Zea mays TaxID=4577 RepID=A0A1D6J3C3_MAIZE|nr:hypothetical protein ZEAMMB73_Zm00001d024994 [Zea mays]